MLSMTYHGLTESNTSDWLLYVWALPQNRWRLRRLHILTYGTRPSCIWWVVYNGSPRSIVLLMLLQFRHCTFVNIRSRLFAKVFVNLAVCIRALFTKPASIFGLVEQAFWVMPLFTEWIGASSFDVILAGPSRHSTTGTSGSRRISLILLHERTRRRIRLCQFCTFIDIVRDGNCNCLL